MGEIFNMCTRPLNSSYDLCCAKNKENVHKSENNLDTDKIVKIEESYVQTINKTQLKEPDFKCEPQNVNNENDHKSDI